MSAYFREDTDAIEVVTNLMENSMSPISESFELAANNEDLASVTYLGIGIYELSYVSDASNDDDDDETVIMSFLLLLFVFHTLELLKTDVHCLTILLYLSL